MPGGTTGGERYERHRLLGEGGGGEVWLAEDRLQPSRLVALKGLSEASRGREDSLRREFATLASLRHPNLVEVFDFDLDPESGLPRFTLEYVEGEDLVATVRREGPEALLDLAAEALRALAFLHDFGLVHRDLKPENLLVRARPRLGSRLVVLDFGLALRGGAAEEPAPGLGGTLPYLAPELFDGAPADRRSDLYALGIVLYEAVHGRPPYLPKGSDLGAFLKVIREGRRARPAMPAGFSEGFARWLEEMIAPDPAARPAEAAEALARLNAASGSGYPVETAVSRAARLASGQPPGRERELAQLWEHLAAADGPRLVWLCGGAGSGKSRLLRWLASDGVARGFSVVVPPQGIPVVGEDRDEAAVEDLLARLRAQAAERPAVVLLDEVEQGGSRTALLLERVAREPKGPPLRVVAALRPAELRHASLRKLLGDTGLVPSLRRVDLEPMGPDGVRALAERATGHEAVSEARVRWLVETSEGNPLVAESLLVEGAWERRGRVHGARTIAESVARRLELLSPGARAWLEALCILGGPSDGAIVARLARLEGPPGLEVAREVAALGLAVERDGRWSPESRAVVEQVRSGLLAERARELHRLAARLSLEVGGEPADPWRLARLWSGAGDAEEAVACALRAAQMEDAAQRPAEAAERYGFTLRHLARRDPRRRELRLKQGEAFWLAGQHQAAARAFGSAVRLSGEPIARAEALLCQARALVLASRFERARVAAEEAREVFRQTSQRGRDAEARRVLAMVLARQSRWGEALRAILGAWEDLVAGSDKRGLADAFHLRAMCESNLRMPDAEGHLRDAMDLYASLGLPQLLAKSTIGLAAWYRRTGRLKEARALLEHSLREAEKRRDLVALSFISNNLATTCEQGGFFDKALHHAREGQAAALYLGEPSRALNSLNIQANVLRVLGRPAEAIEELRSAFTFQDHAIEPELLDTARITLAEAMIAVGGEQRSGTRELLEKAKAGSLERGQKRLLLCALIGLMEHHVAQGSDEEIERTWAEYQEQAREAGPELEGWMVPEAELAGAKGLLGRQRFEEAFGAASRAAECAREADRPDLSAAAMAVVAQALQRSGDVLGEEAALSSGRRALDEAAARIKDSSMRRDFVARSDFLPLRRSNAHSSEHRLLVLYDMIRAVNSETDPEALLESILDMALKVVQAERGMILLRAEEGDAFSVRLARNLERETAEDAETFSRHVVSRASEGEAILSLDAGHDDRFSDFKSVSLYRIRSLMCVPLRSRGRITGTVYVDSRREGRLFSQEDLRFLEAFADHAALALENARARARLENENRRLQVLAGTRVQLDNIIGRSEPMQRVFDIIEKMAASELPVLIQGESGTGKELVARAIHFRGPRRKKIILSENCAALPETLLESELFGHVRGAFTGADRDRVGLFEQAHGGTLFLDEVGDMSPAMQARLLRVIEDGEVRRVGDSRAIRVDVRVIAATNKDLQAEVGAARFREDLLYRLQVLMIQLPPLRERPGDVPLLTERLLDRIAGERSRPAPRLGREVLDLFERYSWPGNVRQLENTLHRLLVLAGDGPIDVSLIESDAGLRSALLGSPASSEPMLSLSRTEKEQIRLALSASGGNRDRAARLLGISRATIYRKIKEYRLG